MVSELEDQASSTPTREMTTSPVTPTPVITDQQSSVSAQQWVIVKQPIGVKLNDNNFLLWKQQITAAIRGLGLQGFLDGKSICPPETTMNSDGNEVTNPTHDFWNRQDQLIVSWLLGSISDAYLLDLVGCNTASAIWSTLMDLFVSQTCARVSQYKQDIGRLKKNNLTMREYLSKMKSLSDALASVGHSLSQEDQVSNITNGLGAEYESVIVSVTSRVEPFTVSEVTALLLAHEKRIESYSLNPDGSTPSANLAFNNGQKKQNITGSQNFKPNQYTYNQQFQGNRGKGRGRGHGNGGRGWSNNKPQCQLCGKFGHIVQKCYHRFDPFYTGFPSESNSSGSSSGSFGNFGGNSGGSSGNSGSQGFYPSANVAAQDSMNDNNTWFPDSGATNHVTSAFSNLNVGSTYHGNSKLQMGNGAGVTNFQQGESQVERGDNEKSIRTSGKPSQDDN
ncbi:hypothetical protein EZV62_021790 [Acer yangbiense]|uniref:CCHC-type domain-containing protein n=1 Tax=Acer yangbiense TaxID=1000413 RepID=A0A5C7H6P1_9ROSI|nr:hypothetical protein EZV62_021790 [Acer yangbiense]